MIEEWPDLPVLTRVPYRYLDLNDCASALCIAFQFDLYRGREDVKCYEVLVRDGNRIVHLPGSSAAI